MSDPKDYSISFVANVDPEINGGLQHNYTMPADATAEQLIGRATMLHDVAWSLVRKRNERIYIRDYCVREQRQRQLAAVRKAGRKVDEKLLQDEERGIETKLLRLEADIRVDAKMAGEDGDAVMGRLHEEARQHLDTVSTVQ